MISDSHDNRLDQSLRDKFNDFRLNPSAGVWRGIAPHIGPPGAPPPRRARRLLPLPLWFGLVALLSGLGGWLLPHGGQAVASRTARPEAAAPVPVASATVAATAAAQAVGAKKATAGAAAAPVAVETGPVQPATASAASATAPVPSKTGRVRPSTAFVTSKTGLADPETVLASSETARTEPAIAQNAETGADMAVVAIGVEVPAALRTLVGLERRAQQYRDASSALLAARPGRDTARLRILRAQRTELRCLQRRTDSLLLALGDAPAAHAPLPAVAAAAADTAAPRRPARPWSLLLTATPEQNTLANPLASNDPLTALRNQELGRNGLQAALLAERQLAPRWSVAGGLGYNQYRTELRLTNRRTDVAVTYDTTRTSTSTDYTSTNRVYSIRLVPVPQLSPIFNANGQILRYDTVYTTRPDTTYTTIVQHDNVRTNQRTITPLLRRTEATTTQTLRPTYRFLTLPVLVRYRLAAPGPARWWADVAAGAQLQFFLGGSQLVSTDGGQSFRTENVRAGQGPFRVFNLALSGSLNLNYALSNRLSLSGGPSLRWQALSGYRPATGLRQQPVATGLQVGVRWKL